MKCVFINCFTSSNEMRIEPVKQYFERMGYDTVYLGSDFHHTKKQYVTLAKDIVPIHAMKYKKNLSIFRLLSHIQFSKIVMERIKSERPDFIYVKVPPNSLVREVAKYKKKNKCKVIFDIFDLWPESLPMPSIAKRTLKPILCIWSNLRDKYLKCADYVFTECDMYKKKLGNRLPKGTVTVYLSKPDIKDFTYTISPPNELNICYLGSINNLIDLEQIEEILRELRQYYVLDFHIIGDGANRNRLAVIAKSLCRNVYEYGLIYDENKKQSILSKCEFGINIMKPTVEVALSIKSIEYFRCGVAIINNLPFDTESIINNYEAGINYKKGTAIDAKYLTKEGIEKMRKNSRRAFEDLFDERKLQEIYESVFK